MATFRMLLLSVLTLTMAFPAAAVFAETSEQRHAVIFEVTGEGAELWQGILNNVENLQKAFGPEQTKIEVVAHSKGLGLLLTTNTALQERLRKIADTGVVFAACENTMQRRQVTKEDLFPFATTVDSGVAEVVRKQEAGWAYIRGV